MTSRIVRFKSWSALLTRWLACLIIAGIVSACASNGRVVDHSFSFDVRRAIPAIEVIDYRYGTSGLPGARAEKWMVQEGRGVNWTGVTGPMTVGDFLYVKWRIKETGEVLEENVDLRHRLPYHMKDQRVCFHIIGKQLYIYVAEHGFLPVGAPEYVAPGAPSQTLPYTHHTKYRIIYPDQPKH